jgi:hypothetical protein
VKRKKRGCLISGVVFIAIILCLLLFLEFVVPWRVTNLVQEQVQTDLKLNEKPVVRIEMHPLVYNLIVGRIDNVYIKAKDVKTKQDFTIDTIEVDVDGLRFNTLQVLKTRRPVVNNIDGGEIKVVLSEKAVNDLVSGQLPGSHVKLEKGNLKFTGDLPYLLPGFTYTVSGTVSVLPDNVLEFKPVPQDIAGLPVPQEIKDYLGGALAIKYGLEEIPDGLEITGVEVSPGKMTFNASIITLDGIVDSVSGGI